MAAASNCKIAWRRFRKRHGPAVPQGERVVLNIVRGVDAPAIIAETIFARALEQHRLPKIAWGEVDMLLGAKAFFVGALWVSFALPASAQIPTYDLVLRNARIIDGSGKPDYRGDVAISGDTIAAIALRIEGGATRVIDVSGQLVAPGFIDVHTHVLRRRGIFEHPT